MEYFAFQWHITEACDQRCKHCYIYALGSHAKFREMALEDMTKVIENCQTFCDKAGGSRTSTSPAETLSFTHSSGRWPDC